MSLGREAADKFSCTRGAGGQPNTQGGMQCQRQDSLGVFLRMTLRLVRPAKAQLLGPPASAAPGTALADVSYHGQLDRRCGGRPAVPTAAILLGSGDIPLDQRDTVQKRLVAPAWRKDRKTPVR